MPDATRRRCHLLLLCGGARRCLRWRGRDGRDKAASQAGGRATWRRGECGREWRRRGSVTPPCPPSPPPPPPPRGPGAPHRPGAAGGATAPYARAPMVSPTHKAGSASPGRRGRHSGRRQLQARASGGASGRAGTSPQAARWARGAWWPTLGAPAVTAFRRQPLVARRRPSSLSHAARRIRRRRRRHSAVCRPHPRRHGHGRAPAGPGRGSVGVHGAGVVAGRVRHERGDSDVARPGESLPSQGS